MIVVAIIYQFGEIKMFCKECGTENLDTEVECKKCKTIINDNLPLNGTERIMIIGFFTGLVSSIFFGILPIIICLGILFIIKKDKKIKILENGKRVFLGYIVILAVMLSIVLLHDYDRYYNKNILILVLAIFMPISAYIIYSLSNLLFFNIIRKHEKWIIENGLFADSKNEKSFIEKTTEKIQSIKTEPLNVADELLKWAELKEKGLISEDEFKKAKEKILDGKL
jgi:hypothetical protein